MIQLLPAASTLVLDAVVKVTGFETCAIGTHLWSNLGAEIGLASSIIALILGGKVARTRDEIENRSTKVFLTAVGATLACQGIQGLIRYISSDGKNASAHEIICAFPQTPILNVAIVAPAAVFAAFAYAQAHDFMRSIANPDEELELEPIIVLDESKGQFINGKANGPGIKTYANGNKLECTFIDGKANGPSRYIFADGSKLEVWLVDGKANGPGTRTFADSGTQLEVCYVNNRANGPGVYKFKDGRKIDCRFEDGIQI